MFLLVAAAFAASLATPDPAVTVDNLASCIRRIQVDYEAGPVLPTRAKKAADAVATCRALAERDLSFLTAAVMATATDFRTERERIDAEIERQPRQTGIVTTSADPWIAAQFDRARSEIGTKTPTSTTSELERLGHLVEQRSREIGTVDVAIKASKAEEARYLAVRDGLWVMECNGEITLAYGEGMGYSVSSSYEEQCAELQSRVVASRH